MNRTKPYERKSLPAPSAKRMRPSQTEPKSARKGKVAAEHGSSQAHMKFPVEIFAEVSRCPATAYYLELTMPDILRSSSI